VRRRKHQARLNFGQTLSQPTRSLATIKTTIPPGGLLVLLPTSPRQRSL
jgi:hypothetical protein